MARAGRPQGAPRGRSRAANELAELLREVTRGVTVRELAQRFGGGKTAWSEYRSGSRVIPLGRLGLVIKECVPDPRRGQELLARARRLHAQALTATAESEAAPPPGLADALRRAQEDLAASGRLVEGLLVLMTMLQEQAKAAPPGSAEAAEAATAGHGPGSAPSEPPRIGLDELLDQLVAARSVEESARAAVAEVRARCEAARPVPWLPAGTGEEAPPTEDEVPPAEGPASQATAVDLPLSTELARVHHVVVQQREHVQWLWEQARAADRTPYDVIEGVVLERLDTLPAVRGEGPGAPPPAGRTSPRTYLAVLGAALAVALGAGAVLVGVVVGGERTVLWSGPTPGPTVTGPVTPGPRATVSTPSPSAPPTPSAAPSSAVPRPFPSPVRPVPSPVPRTAPTHPAATPTPQSPGTAYAVSPDRHSVLQWTGRGSSWKVIGTAADQLYAGTAGLFATNPGDGRIFKYDEPSSSWAQIGLPGEEFVVEGDALYAITVQRDAVVRWTGLGAEWVPVGGAADRLYAGGAGLFATNPDTGELYRYAGYGEVWVKAGGPGADFAVGPDYVARLSPDGKEIWQANAKGSNWRRIGGAARNLYAGGAGLFAVDAVTGRILRYDGAPGSWTPIGAAGVGLTVGDHSVYRIAEGLGVSRWTGHGAEWTALGISASSIAAVG